MKSLIQVYITTVVESVLQHRSAVCAFLTARLGDGSRAKLLNDTLPALKQEGFLYRTAMPDHKNVLGPVHIAVVSDTTLTASSFFYSSSAHPFELL